MSRRLSSRLSKNERVLALIATMAAISFSVGVIVAVVLGAESAALDAAAARLTMLRNAAAALESAVEEQDGALGDYVLSRDDRARQRFLDGVAGEQAQLDQLRVHASGDPRIGSDLDELAGITPDWRERIATPALAAVAAGDAVAIERFSSRAADDHTDVHRAFEELSESLDVQESEIVRQEAAAENLEMLGMAIAFGFLVLAFGVALFVVRRFGLALERDARQASVLNKFTEVTTFAADDREVADANLVALERLAQADAAVTHILNRSMDRAVPEAISGEAVADVLPLHALSRCAGVIRGTMYVADDLADDLTVHCPIYPATTGTLACIPLTSGEAVGAVHLYWHRPFAFSLDLRASVARITEHAALAIGNRRLLAALHGQANTDARTGLVNSRAFDRALEEALASRAGDESVSVLMLDVDHFKVFNDRHGHPAGDEALRTFAAVLRSCMRDGDIAARYGGEEFAVLLRGITVAGAAAIGERIRARTEATIISLSPGLTDRITISIGIATAPEHATDRVTLLRLADEALYRAKELGRNRVVTINAEDASSLDDSAPAEAGPPEASSRGALAA